MDTTTGEFDTLLLSGGSSKGLVVLGAIQGLLDSGLLKNIKTYVGTSVGSVIGYLLAIGYTPIEIVVYICTNGLLERMQHFNIVAMMNGGGACSFSHLHEQLEKMTIAKIGYLPTLQDLQNRFNKTLVCVTYNISACQVEYLNPVDHPNLPCVTALRMSSNLPLVFEKFKYGDHFYIDGGIAEHFAVPEAERRGSKVLGILVNEDLTDFQKNGAKNTLEYIYQLFSIPVNENTRRRVQEASDKCRIIALEYPLKAFDFNISTQEKLDMFSAGYNQVSSDE